MSGWWVLAVVAAFVGVAYGVLREEGRLNGLVERLSPSDAWHNADRLEPGGDLWEDQQ